MVVGRAKPRRGFVSTSAYLAVSLNNMYVCKDNTYMTVVVYTSSNASVWRIRLVAGYRYSSRTMSRSFVRS
jgi:hypothetical protein